jgi:hypothetical protein
MLDDIRDEDILPIDSCCLECLVQERSGRADKWVARFVLNVAGRFAHQDHPGGRGSFSPDRLRRPRVQLAAATGLESAA